MPSDFVPAPVSRSLSDWPGAALMLLVDRAHVRATRRGLSRSLGTQALRVALWPAVVLYGRMGSSVKGAWVAALAGTSASEDCLCGASFAGADARFATRPSVPTAVGAFTVGTEADRARPPPVETSSSAPLGGRSSLTGFGGGVGIATDAAGGRAPGRCDDGTDGTASAVP
jgi:hypothetical protein